MSYGSLMTILKHSDLGINSDGQYKIECHDEQWAQIVQVDDNLVS